MKILMSPQVHDNLIKYTFNNDIVEIEIDDIKESFDFTGVSNGKLKLFNKETDESLIKTSLPVNPIVSAEKKEGILYLELLNWIAEEAPYEQRFPEWIDAKDYVAPEIDSGLDTGNSLAGVLREKEVLSGKAEMEDNELENWGDF